MLVDDKTTKRSMSNLKKKFEGVIDIYMEAFELKWVNTDYIQYGVNLLKLEISHIFRFLQNIEYFTLKMKGFYKFLINKDHFYFIGSKKNLEETFQIISISMIKL